MPERSSIFPRGSDIPLPGDLKNETQIYCQIQFHTQGLCLDWGVTGKGLLRSKPARSQTCPPALAPSPVARAASGAKGSALPRVPSQGWPASRIQAGGGGGFCHPQPSKYRASIHSHQSERQNLACMPKNPSTARKYNHFDSGQLVNRKRLLLWQ